MSKQLEWWVTVCLWVVFFGLVVPTAFAIVAKLWMMIFTLIL